MKLIVVAALALVAVVAAAPAKEGAQPVQIVRSDYEKQPDGAYNFALESDDGTVREETGEIKEVKDEDGKPHSVIVVRGSYAYVDPESNKKITIIYTADENGFHPEGESIPKPAR